MFLDEKLLHIAREKYPTNLEEAKAIINSIMKECFESALEVILIQTASKEVSEFDVKQIIRANIKRVDRTFRSFVKQLDSEGKGFIKEDAFRILINSKEKLAEFHY